MIEPEPETTIRLYQPSDRPDFERICLSTGLNGQLDKHFCDREAFVKIWLGPYLHLNPDCCWAAVREGKMVGYLVGTFDGHFNKRAALHLLPALAGMAFKWLSGQYRHHPPTGRFLKWLFFRSWREHPKIPADSCSFHFNIDKEEGKNSMAGFMLGRAFLDEARIRDKKHWHAVIFAGGGRRPVKVYQKLGFTIADSKPCTLFEEGGVVLAVIQKEVSAEGGGLID